MYVGIDMGGTNIRIAAAPSLDTIRFTGRANLLNLPDYEANMHQLIEAIATIAPQTAGIGFSTPGRPSPDNSMIVASTYAGQWVNKPFIETLASHFNCPVVMRHDTESASLSEVVDNPQVEDFLLVAWGTGIGGATLGRPAGRLKVLRVSDKEHAIYFRPWQEACGGKGIEHIYGKPASQLSEAEWQHVMNDFYMYLVRLAEGFRPNRLVFAGGIAMKQWKRLLPAFARLKAEHPEFQKLEIVPAQFGEDAALYGVLSLLR